MAYRGDGGDAMSGAERGQRSMIMVVDDDPMNLELMSDVLESVGYGVVTAQGGAEAMALFQSHPGGIDLVIFDLLMPGMDGGEVMRRLRQVDPRVRMILSTGYVEPKRLNDLLKQGVDAVLRKPYRTEVFAATVRRVLALPRP